MRRLLRRGIASPAAQDPRVLTFAVDDSPLRKIRSPQLRAPTKNIRQQKAVGYFLCRLAHIRAARSNLGLGSSTGRRGAVRSSACPHPACAVRFWAWFYAVIRISAIEKRFRNVAEGNISRLREAQAFHAAVKRPPYFMFARQRRHFTAGHSVSGMPSPRLRGLF